MLLPYIISAPSAASQTLLLSHVLTLRGIMICALFARDEMEPLPDLNASVQPHEPTQSSSHCYSEVTYVGSLVVQLRPIHSTALQDERYDGAR